jgi:DNA recombination-dependent growth factor C
VNRGTAEKIIASVKRIDLALDEIADSAEEIDKEDLRKTIRRTCALLIIEVYEKITKEVVEYFPDFHPDKDKN